MIGGLNYLRDDKHGGSIKQQKSEKKGKDSSKHCCVFR